jgi:uncharacterized protein YjiS (DUF1127 family)
MTTLIDTFFGRVHHTVYGRVHHTAPKSGFLSRVNASIALYRSRARLAALEDHQLNDIGLTKKEAHAEASRPVWDVPATWKY